jgi:hypothetical protein
LSSPTYVFSLSIPLSQMAIDGPGENSTKLRVSFGIELTLRRAEDFAKKKKFSVEQIVGVLKHQPIVWNHTGVGCSSTRRVNVTTRIQKCNATE